MKRMISFCLVVVLVLSCLPSITWAAEIVDSGVCGDNLTWVLTDDGTLTISGTGPMTNWLGQSKPSWTAFQKTIKTVVIEAGVTSIGDHAFYHYDNLTKIIIPDSVTDIGEWAFAGCSSLVTINLPVGLTSIQHSVFNGCSSLTSITIPASVTSIGEYAFCGCSSLTSMSIPEGVTRIEKSLLRRATSLSEISIPDSVTYIGDGAFYECSYLTDIAIPENVTYIGAEAFSECYFLESIVIPDGVVSINDGTFNKCYLLKDIVIPNSVEAIGDKAFYSCQGLESIYIPDSVKSIGLWAFYNCANLTSITIPNSVTTIGGSAFANCLRLNKIKLPDGITDIGHSAFQGCSMKSIAIPENVTLIGAKAFRGCRELQNITIPSTVSTIGAGAFQNCTNLGTITFRGNAPKFILNYCFEGVTATAYYPVGNPTWTEDVMQDYGGDITWVPFDVKENVVDFKVEPMFSADELVVGRTVEYALTLYVNGELVPIESYVVGNSNADIVEFDGAESKVVDGVRYVKLYLVGAGTTNVTFGTSLQGVYETVEINVSAISEANIRKEWIRQHLEYAASEEYDNEIVSGYNKRMLAVFRDALEDTGIGIYQLTQSTTEILDLDFELTDVQMYELILAEILYSRGNLNMSQEAYQNNLNKALHDIADSLVDIAKNVNTASKLPDDAMESIMNTYSILKTLSVDADNFDSVYSQFIALFKKNISKPDLIEGLVKDVTFLADGIVVDGLFEMYDSLDDVLQYMANYIAFQSTSKQFEDVFRALYIQIMKYEGWAGVGEFDELGIIEATINWGAFQVAVDSFIISLVEYKEEGAGAVAAYAVERFQETGVNWGRDALKDTAIFGIETIVSKIPVLNAILSAKNVLNVGVLLAEIFTNVDERAYAREMLAKIYCISVFFDKTVSATAASMSEDDFYASTVFDEAVSIYRGTQLLAAEFALNYSDMLLSNAIIDLYNYGQKEGSKQSDAYREKLEATISRYSNSLKRLQEQKKEIQTILCHDPSLKYDPMIDAVYQEFEDAKVYIVACPVDVVVTNQEGEQVANLSGVNNEIALGYESFFRTIKLASRDEYIKIAIVPAEYQVTLQGTDNGRMHTFVVDYDTDENLEVDIFLNIPVTDGSIGYIDGDSERKVVMDDVEYYDSPTVLQNLGDVNGDGKLNAKDATAILKKIVGKLENPIENFDRIADVNEDGKVNAKDATKILKTIVGKDSIEGWD